MKFSEFPIDEKILKGIEKANFTECMPVQEKTLAVTLGGKDVFVQSQTGTGKTAAFLISIFQIMLKNSNSGFKALIIAPTRELAVQIEKEAKLLSSFLDFRTACFYGGVGYEAQEKEITKGVDIFIGTPGRLIDLGDKGKINFKKFRMLVIDEADRLFDMGFLPDIKRMLYDMPPVKERMTMLFSATLNQGVRQLAWDYMNEPSEIEIEPEKVTVDKITQSVYHVERKKKMSLLLGILEKAETGGVLIFTNTRQAACEVSERLELNGYNCCYLSGDLPQQKRLKIINDVKNGKIRFLVATDVAARGLHIDDLVLVINYDIPEDAENYVHRIGRTARTGKSGRAVSLACESFVYGLEAIEKFIGIKIPLEWAEDSMFREDRSRNRSFRTEKYLKPAKGSSTRRTAVPARREAAPKTLKKTAQRPAPRTTAAAPYGSKKRKEGKVAHQRHLPEKMKSTAIDDRLQYYREKYGENFNIPAGPVAEKPEKISFILKIKKFLLG